MLLASPELLGEIIRNAVERLLDSRLPGELNCGAAGLLRATVGIVLFTGRSAPAANRRQARDRGNQQGGIGDGG
jgi:hypothetical protein